MNDETLVKYIDFIQRAEALKSTLRTAYTATGRQESTAEHSWRLALLALVLAEEIPEADPLRLLRLCLVHDLGEAIHGDIPAVDQRAGQPKSAAERADLEDLTSGLPPRGREAILALWEDYETGGSLEARLVKGLDKLETIIQHNQGLNPERFDYPFNLGYGRKHTATHPILEQIRRLADRETARRASAGQAASEKS